MDRKLKVYLDTSVISYLQQEDTPERMKDTLALWKQFEAKKYDIYLSQVTLDEVGECRAPKRTALFEYLSRISYTKLEITNEVLKVANQIIDMVILTPKSFGLVFFQGFYPKQKIESFLYTLQICTEFRRVNA